MTFDETQKSLFEFYSNELKNNILSFWLPRCLDTEFGGFLNCFTNDGSTLVSHDKYTWSQGRFVWLFSRLAVTESPIFSKEERNHFLSLAQNGATFLMKNCLIKDDSWRCTFLMDQEGQPKFVEGSNTLDMSIYADCFVVLGLGMYAYASKDKDSYIFAKNLYQSIIKRIKSGSFNTLPYPLSPSFKAHGIPMILCNTAFELYRAALVLDKEYSQSLLTDITSFSDEVLNNFVDEDNCLHEIITKDNKFFDKILGQHMNPGHTIEDVWFHLDAASLTNRNKEKIFNIALKALDKGWDSEFGGLLHFCSMTGGKPFGDAEGVESEPMTKQLSGWSDKLWWIHSEALYTSLRCFFESQNPAFASWYQKLHSYTFSTFPNPNKEVGEWIQIRQRDGSPQEKVVALPVKDPFHIIRNFILILELLHSQINS